MLEDTKLFLNWRRMRNIRRCSNYPTLNPIEVATHSYYVTVLAMILADEYNTYVDDNNLKFHPLDDENQLETARVEVVMRKALLHDTEESYTGDINWNVKHRNPEINQALDKSIEERIQKAYENTKVMEKYYRLGRECKEGLEGQIVGIADMLELAVFLREEETLGNATIAAFKGKCVELIKEMPLAEILWKHTVLFPELIHFINGFDEYFKRLDAETMYDID